MKNNKSNLLSGILRFFKKEEKKVEEVIEYESHT